MRLMGLDYGSKTVGVAVTDGLGLTVIPVETIGRREENKLRRTCARIEALCEAYQTEKIVIGLPLNMDGSEGGRAALARSFGELISRRTGLPVEFEDERLTTVEADEILGESGMRKERRKQVIDQLAAVLILEAYRSRNS